jgi:hypothetical protein
VLTFLFAKTLFSFEVIMSSPLFTATSPVLLATLVTISAIFDMKPCFIAGAISAVEPNSSGALDSS